MDKMTEKTRGSTNLFLLAVAIFLICTFISISGGKGSVFLIGFLITLAVVLTGAVVRAIEFKRSESNAA